MIKLIAGKNKTGARNLLPHLEYEVYMLISEGRKTLPETAKIIGISREETSHLNNMASRRIEKLTEN